MLLVPLVTGAAAGAPRGERMIWVLLFAATALGLFCLRTPVEAGYGIVFGIFFIVGYHPHIG
jgi:hypothetical protein